MRHSRLATAVLVATGLAATVVAATTSARQRPVDDSALTAMGAEILIDVGANDGLSSPVQVATLQRPPAHGTATAVAPGIFRYVPQPGFTGRDSFLYWIKAGREYGIATVTVDVGQSLMLRGKATDAPLSGATVSATVDGHTFTTVADAAGDYALAVISTDGGMVTLAAQGTGPQAVANFQAYLGDFTRLQDEAGSDGILSRDENHAVQVTNVSTAQAVLAREALAGVPITDDAALAQALESLDYARVMRAAAAIKLAVDEGFALPAGVPDTLALVSSASAMEGFIADVEEEAPGALQAAAQSIASDPELTEPVDADAIGALNLLLHAGAPGSINVLHIQGDRFEFGEDGTGAVLKASENPDPGTTWTMDGNQVVVVPDAPVTITSYPVIPGHGQVRQLITEREYRLSSLGGTGASETFAVATTYDYSYPDTPALQPGTATDTETRLAVRDDAGIPFTTAELQGTFWALPTAATGYANSNNTGSDLFELGASGTGTRWRGTTFDWSVDAAGRLQVDYHNGGGTMVYTRIATDARKGVGLMAQYRSITGARASRYALAMEADAPAERPFTPAIVARSWLSGQTVSRPDAGALPFHLVFDAGPQNPGFHVTRDAAGTAFTTRIGWQVANGWLDAVYYRIGSTPVHYCAVGVEAGCFIWQIRRWIPMAADGDRRYVIEEFLVDYAGNGNFEIVTQRPTFYDEVARPSFPLPVMKAPVQGASKLRKARALR